MHGDGTNRWFDKSFQLIVFENGFRVLMLSIAGLMLQFLRTFGNLSCATKLLERRDTMRQSRRTVFPQTKNLCP